MLASSQVNTAIPQQQQNPVMPQQQQNTVVPQQHHNPANTPASVYIPVRPQQNSEQQTYQRNPVYPNVSINSETQRPVVAYPAINDEIEPFNKRICKSEFKCISTI